MVVEKKHGLTIRFDVDAVYAQVDTMLQQAVDLTVTRVSAEAERLRTLGMSNGAIRTKLYADAEAGTGIFAGLDNAVGRVASDAVNMANQAAYYETVTEDAQEQYDWVKDPGADSCDTCIERDTWPARTFEEWQEEGLPGSGVTICQHNCRCSLVPVDIMEGS